MVLFLQEWAPKIHGSSLISCGCSYAEGVGNVLVGTSEVFQAVMVCITLCTIIKANVTKVASKQFNVFPRKKRAVQVCFGTHDTLQCRQSTLATGLPGQLSRHGHKSTTLYNTWQRQSSTMVLLAHYTLTVCRRRPVHLYNQVCACKGKQLKGFVKRKYYVLIAATNFSVFAQIIFGVY